MSEPNNRGRWIHALYWLGPLLALAIVFAFFAIRTPETFLTVRNLETILRQSTITGVAALGMTLIIVSGGIDLSVGSVVALCSVVVALGLRTGLDPLLAGAAAVAAGVACGFVNGLLIVSLRVVPFIVTLGTMLVLRGLAKGIAHNQTVNPNADTWLNTLTASLAPDQRWLLLPPCVWILFVLALAVAFVLRYTPFGRHAFAIGSNEQAARLCGIRIARTKWILYAAGAGFAGLAGLMQFSQLTLGDPTAAAGLELSVIAAVVIGGGSLSGGEGSVLGTLVGAFLMTVIAVGCSHLMLENWVQEIVTGVMIVLAVAFDRFRHRRSGG